MKVLLCRSDVSDDLPLIVDDDIYERLKDVRITDNRRYPHAAE